MDMEATTTIKNITALEASRAPNAQHSVRGGAARPSTISHACSSVRNAAGNACVCPQGIMGTKLCALATTTGRPRKEDPSALEESFPIFLPLSLFPTESSSLIIVKHSIALLLTIYLRFVLLEMCWILYHFVTP
ncbi:Uncharacterized protein TCM_018553 [Theobroma cacao]|uniref:Uncharacterized protein n=1 Tax=Theobroma cacao TaxID=3641 RepID=A0A061EEV3_THECC|nr:Uncharacterized protein TCM_018553 [Theobroma cacao]